MLTIYSKNGCPACVSAANFLTNLDVPFTTVKIDEDDNAKQFVLGRMHRSVPQIYHGDKLFVVGGWLGLMKMSEDEIKAALYGK